MSLHFPLRVLDDLNDHRIYQILPDWYKVCQIFARPIRETKKKGSTDNLANDVELASRIVGGLSKHWTIHRPHNQPGWWPLDCREGHPQGFGTFQFFGLSFIKI